MRTIINSRGSMTFHHVSDVAQTNDAAHISDHAKLIEILTPYIGRAFVLFEGGADVAPERYGEQNRCSGTNPRRDEEEFALYKAARELNIPMLGICRGHQLMNVAAGGTLYQDLRTDLGKGHNGMHQITFEDQAFSSKFYDLMKSNPGIYSSRQGRPDVVNSMHHQALKDVAADAIVLARHVDDMTPEAVLYPYGLSVQWHPEFMGHIDFVRYMFERFVK